MNYTLTTRKSNYKAHNAQWQDAKVAEFRCRECENYLQCKENDIKPKMAYSCYKKRGVIK